ncbi:MAG: UDP-glucose dehydrogenase family protein [Candidatus Helarchaeota archaeon]
MNIMIVGTGYVGLTTGVVLAKLGKEKKISLTSYCIDSIQEKTEMINAGTPPFYEQGLEVLLKEVIKEKRLLASTHIAEFINDVDIIFICVGTPSRDDGSMDLQFIQSASRDIGNALRSAKSKPVICVKSTVLPGTTRNVVLPIIEKHSGKKVNHDFGIMATPEFLREGNAIHDNLHPDRIILGEMNERHGRIVEDFYEKLLSGVPLLRMSIESAELVKYTSNALLAMKISFANEISRLAETIPGVDVTEVMKGVGLDERISSKFLNAGVGFGGSCFPKDVSALVDFTKRQDLVPHLLQSILDINETQPIHFVNLLMKNIPEDLEDLTISVLGLAFKPGTSDMRHARSLKIIEHLKQIKKVKTIKVHDPIAMETAREELSNLKIDVTFSKTIEECIQDSDACLIVTEWDVYKKILPKTYQELMRNPFVLDGRRIYDKNEFSSKIKYKAIGLGEISKK